MSARKKGRSLPLSELSVSRSPEPERGKGWLIVLPVFIALLLVALAAGMSGQAQANFSDVQHGPLTGGTPTDTPVPTDTPIPSPTCAPPVWSTASPIPAVRGRGVGATIGNYVYLFGGRIDNFAYTRTIYRYDSGANLWQLFSATVPHTYTADMAAGVLNFPEGQRIFLFGGVGASVPAASRSYAFNPTTGAFTNKASLPSLPICVPGGWAVANNKFYVFGGYDPYATGGGAMCSDILMYDPATNVWTRLPSRLSLARAYIAAEYNPADGMIYLAGGSQLAQPGSLTDETVFEEFNPANNTITIGPPMLEAKSNNQGYIYGGKFYVPAGGVTPPHHNTNAQVYDPATHSWSMSAAVTRATRNYAKGYGANGAPYILGGLDLYSERYWNYNQKFTQSATCPNPSPTVTVTPTRTPTGVTSTPTVTRTPTRVSCVMSFTDVQPTDYFYESVRYMYCRGIISGYEDNTFRPYNNTTRGQLCKIIVLAEGWQIECTVPGHFTDLVVGDPFYCFVETAYARGIIAGYADGTFRPNENVTRAQLCKIIVLAKQWQLDCPMNPHFSDVPPENPFYCFIETAFSHNIIAGYADGTFQPGNNATRGQICKIVYLAVTQP